jgi:hypothetical protein
MRVQLKNRRVSLKNKRVHGASLMGKKLKAGELDSEKIQELASAINQMSVSAKPMMKLTGKRFLI